MNFIKNIIKFQILIISPEESSYVIPYFLTGG